MKTLSLWLWYLLPANPLVLRIVQGGSRRPRHLGIRMAYLGGLIALVVGGLLFGEGMSGHITVTELAKSGALVFKAVSYGQVLLVCLLAPLFMAGAIGQEQSSNTYDILLTTPLSNLQIVLGVLAGRLFFVLALLASGLPLFAVLLLFGGVPVTAVFVSFAVAAISAITVGAVAVTLSVLRAGGRRAVFGFVIAVAAYLVTVYSLDTMIVRRLGPSASAANNLLVSAPPTTTVAGQTSTWLTPLHPLLTLEASMNTANYRPPPAESLSAYPAVVRFYLSQPFGAFAALGGLTSATLLIFSSTLVRRLGQPRTAHPWWTRLARITHLARRGTVDESGQYHRAPRTVWANPIAWREARTRGNRLNSILLRIAYVTAALSAATALLWFYHTGALPMIQDPAGHGTLTPNQVMRLALTVLLLAELAVVVLVALYMSASSVSREREDGTLDLLLTTPITPKQYLWGKLRGLVSFLTLLMAVPVATAAIIAAYAWIGAQLDWPTAWVEHRWIDRRGASHHQPTALLLPEAPLILALMTVPFIALCVMIGMSWSLRAKGVLNAIIPSVGVVGAFLVVTGFCGYNAVQNIPWVGPVIGAFSPIAVILAAVDPWQHVAGFADQPAQGRLALAGCTLAAAATYALIVKITQATLVRGFDQTVRQLSGDG